MNHQNSDLNKNFTHGSLFSGIGGFDLAAEWMGWENKFHCEWNEFGQKVLKYYWPKAISYGDIKDTDFNVWRGKINILTGGFPCQPFSQAGKRKGKADDRHLWPEMLRAIREIQPNWIVGENVLGLLNWNRGMVFHEVQTDLEAAGYFMFPYVLPACAINAPHRRDRVWFIAYSNGSGNDTTKGSKNGIWQQQGKEQSGNRGAMQINGFSNEQLVTNSDSNGCNRSNSEHEINASKGREYALNDFEPIDITNTTGIGLERSIQTGKHDGQRGQVQERGKIGEYLYENKSGIQFENFPTQPPICSRNDGLSSELVGITVPKHRTESIKGYGNAIVPQVALQIFKAIEQYEKQELILKVK